MQVKAKYTIIIHDEKDSNLDETIEIDCTESIDHHQSAKVTEHATEEGFKVADHVVEESIHVSLDGIIGNADSSHSVNEPYRIFDVFKFLLSSRKKCTVISTRMTYVNMICTSFTEKKTGSKPTESLFFNLNFTQIRTAKTKISKITKAKLEVKKASNTKEQNTKRKKVTEDRFQTKVNKSKITPKKASETIVKKNTSVKKAIPDPNKSLLLVGFEKLTGWKK